VFNLGHKLRHITLLGDAQVSIFDREAVIEAILLVCSATSFIAHAIDAYQAGSKPPTFGWRQPRSKTRQSRFDHAEILVEQLGRRAEVDPAVWLILKLFSEPLAMRLEILKRTAIVEHDVPVDNQFNCP
jgi:hypothetical protein